MAEQDLKALCGAIFESSPEGILVADRKTKRFTHANPAICAMLGYTREELLRRKVNDIHPREHLQCALKHFEAQSQGRQTLARDVPCRRKDGSVFYADIQPTPLLMAGRAMLVGFFRDTTARKATEEALRTSQQQVNDQVAELTEIYRCTPVGLCVLDRDLRYVRINERLAAMNGLPVEAHLGRSVAEVLPHLAPTFRKMWGPIFHNGKPVLDFEVEGVTPRAPCVRRSWLVSSFPRRSATGQFTGLLCAAVEITDLKRTEQALHEAEERFRAFMDHSPSIAWAKDAAGRFVYLSKTCDSRLGMRLQDWLGKTDEDLFPPDVAGQFRRNDLAVLKSRKPLEVIEHAPDRHGKQCSWLTVKFPFQDTSGQRYVGGVAIDMTDRVQAEQRLRDTQKAHLDQTRRLAREAETRLEAERAEISRHLHDGVGQSLTSHMMRLAWIEKRLRANDPALGDELKRACDHAGQMIDELRKVARSLRPVAIEHEGLIPAIRSHLAEFQRLSGVKCRMVVRPVSLVVKDPCATAIFRIIQEATTNVARHAHASRCAVSLSVARDRLVLTIHDNGRGAAPGVLEGHLSLGVLGMKERAWAVGGELTVQKGPKAGVQVRACFPLADQRPADQRPVGRRTNQVKAGSAHPARPAPPAQ